MKLIAFIKNPLIAGRNFWRSSDSTQSIIE
jgi:hypothetical protein